MENPEEARIKEEIDSIAEQIDAILKKIDSAMPGGQGTSEKDAPTTPSAEAVEAGSRGE